MLDQTLEAVLPHGCSMPTDRPSRPSPARCRRASLAALRGLRLQRTAALLARGDLAVGAVAARCGFADAKLFSRRFAARFGCPPRVWRIQARTGEALLSADDPALAPLAARLGTSY